MAFLAANTPKSKVDDSTIDQSSGLQNSPNTLSRVIINPVNPPVSVPEGGFSAEGESFSVTSQSLNPFKEYTSSFRPSPALPEDNGSGLIFHHNDKSSEEHSIVRLQMDLEHPQTSTTLDSQDRLTTTYSLSLLPAYDLSTINFSETNTVEGNNQNASHDQTDGTIQDSLNFLPHPSNRGEQEEGMTDGHKEDHNSSIPSFFDSKGLTLSLPYNSEVSNPDVPAEGSESGSGLYSNRLNQEFDEVPPVASDLSTFSFKVDNIGKRSRSTGIKMVIETNEAGSKISSKKVCETAAEKEIKENESELSGEEEEEMEGEGVHDIGSQRVRKVDGETDKSARQLNSTAGCDMLREREIEVETVVGKIIYTESGSGDKIESNFGVFSWPEDIHGSGEGRDGGDDGKGKGKKASDDEEGIKAGGGDGGEDRNKDDLQLSISLPAEVPLFDSSDENGDGDGHDEEGRNMSLDSQVVWGNSTLEDKEVDGDGERNGGPEREEHIKGGGREGSDAAVNGESLQQFSSVEGLLFAAKRPVLAHLVPLLRLTDGSKDTEEGKYSAFPQPCLSVTESDRTV